MSGTQLLQADKRVPQRQSPQRQRTSIHWMPLHWILLCLFSLSSLAADWGLEANSDPEHCQVLYQPADISPNDFFWPG